LTTAPKAITIQFEQVQIVAKNDSHLETGKVLKVSSGDMLSTEVKKENTTSLKQGLKTQAREIETTADTHLKIESGKVNITGADIHLI
jgi:hypothetical protein